jgi:SAM-dependent methyltransferase
MDYAAAAETIGDVAALLVERVAVEPGMEVLDVACGTGNATIPAAGAGARVTGLDPSPALLAIARERAADAMVEIDWVEGDPGDLPFGDGSFDRVTTVFGYRDERIARELRRVCRGRIGVCWWTPDGALGRMLGMVADAAWGTEQGVTELLGEGAFERREVELREESVERFADFMLQSLGASSGPLRARFVHCLDEANLAGDGTLRFLSEYLLAVTDC